MKKCPVCNSTRTQENIGYFNCKKCGYIWKKRIKPQKNTDLNLLN
jgi:ribosomal protein L37AE/L43A